MKRFLHLFICFFCFQQLGTFAQTSEVFFTRYDEYSGRVYSDDLAGGSPTILVDNIDRPNGIAIDWSVTPHKIYVGVSGDSKITRYDIDGKNPVDIITGQSGIRDIELNLGSRKIYWLKDTYSDDQIYKADMDGVNSNVTSIYSTSTIGRNLWGLALDVHNNRLWITERGSTCMTSRLRRMTLSGGSAITLDDNICNPHDIEYYDGNIYFLMGDGLIRADADGGHQTNISTSAAAAIMLAIDGSHSRAYWTNTGSVVRIDLDGTHETTIFSGDSPLQGIDTDYPNPSALPVELTSFTASIVNNSVHLNWQTATEANNYGFEVERARLRPKERDYAEASWETLGFVEGHGNSNSPKEYSFIDELKLEPTPKQKLHYRLKQIDTDGEFTYSEIVEVEIGLPTKFELFQNYPNPFNPSTNIDFQLPEKSFASLKVYDILGKEVAILVNEEKEAGKYSLKFDAGNLSSGIYFCRFIAGDYINVKKMVLAK